METFDLRLKSPFTALLAGPTGSGKTQLIASLIAKADDVCDTLPKEIIYCYGVWQKSFEKIEGITFPEGMLGVKKNISRDGVSHWIIVDNLMNKANGQTDDLYTKYSHHLNLKLPCCYKLQTRK